MQMTVIPVATYFDAHDVLLPLASLKE